MTNIEFLLKRQSTPLLTEPAPDQEILDKILTAGMRVPDHGGLKPWHFHVIQGDGLQRLSDLFVEAVTLKTSNQAQSAGDNDLDKKIAKAAKMPFRAPMIIVVSSKFSEHGKVPQTEQMIAAGCCAHAMQIAASVLGYGAMWRTGELAYNKTVKQGLSIEENNEIIGFLYIGSPSKPLVEKPFRPYEQHVSYWS